MKQADVKLLIRPGTDGALACAVMHVLFRDGLCRLGLSREIHRCAARVRRASQDPARRNGPSKICDIPVADIEAFAKLIGETKRTYFRIGYGFTRSRNGAVNMHAVTCIPAVTGAWQYEGGGALHSNSGMYRWNKTMIEGLDVKSPGRPHHRPEPHRRRRCWTILMTLQGGPPVKALFVQNTNPASVAPDQTKVKQGLAREDLFTCVHEQFMTETAKFADIVLPATMFLEHDDIYQGGGHSHIMLGRKLVEPPGECRNNHEVICDLAQRVGAEHPGFDMSARELIDWTLTHSNRPGLTQLDAENWIDVQPDFEAAHNPEGLRLPGRQVPLQAALGDGAVQGRRPQLWAGRQAAGVSRTIAT